jgi:nucleoside-diphosphate-sugar epimerase
MEQHGLVTGSTGQLGAAPMRRLQIKSQSASGLDIEPAPFTQRVGPICDQALVKQCIRPDRSVLHAATLHKAAPHHAVARGHEDASVRTNHTREPNEQPAIAWRAWASRTQNQPSRLRAALVPCA